MPALTQLPDAVLAEHTTELSNADDVHFPPHNVGYYSNAKAVGRFGEQMAFEVMMRQAANGSLNAIGPFTCDTGYWEIDWVNSDMESGKPYDLECRHSKGKVIRAEVKSTQTRDKANFEISTAELMHAKEASEQAHPEYVILRVYIIDQKIDIIRTPWQLLEKKGATLYMHF